MVYTYVKRKLPIALLIIQFGSKSKLIRCLITRTEMLLSSECFAHSQPQPNSARRRSERSRLILLAIFLSGIQHNSCLNNFDLSYTQTIQRRDAGAVIIYLESFQCKCPNRQDTRRKKAITTFVHFTKVISLGQCELPARSYIKYVQLYWSACVCVN